MDKKEELNYADLHKQLLSLADTVQDSGRDNKDYQKQLAKSIEEIKSIQQRLKKDQENNNRIAAILDKDQAIQGEKNSNIFYQLEQLEKRISELETTIQKNDDYTKKFIEKIVLLIIGSLIPWVFSMFTGN